MNRLKIQEFQEVSEAFPKMIFQIFLEAFPSTKIGIHVLFSRNIVDKEEDMASINNLIPRTQQDRNHINLVREKKTK